MSRRFSVAAFLATLAQAQSPDEVIAGLCRSESASPSDYSGTDYAPRILEPFASPFLFTLTSSQPDGSTADAFWLTDDEGAVLELNPSPTAASATFDLTALQPPLFGAYVHYGPPLCRVAMANMTYSLDGRIERFYAENYDNCCPTSDFPPDVLAAATPNVTVDYATLTGTVTYTLSPNHPVPFVYARGPGGRLLAYDEPAEVTQVETHTLTVTGLSPYGTTFQGCAPLGGLAVCSEMSLTSTITASLRE